MTEMIVALLMLVNGEIKEAWLLSVQKNCLLYITPARPIIKIVVNLSSKLSTKPPVDVAICDKSERSELLSHSYKRHLTIFFI